ncbi:MAG: peptide chain release factor N(5)-glutamine methyltransferase [Candidatus Dadabacteria bacterium]|nr:peptide chain release factor N(5)-glutamine methyltransferase [Candidatus Dadabacteria bacterium]
MKKREGIFLRELYLKGKNLLIESDIENPELEASLLLRKVLGIKTVDIFTHPDKCVQSEKVKEFESLLERRLKREPIAYILGEKEFYSRPFIVTPDVLIPRPETELLVEEVLKITKSIPRPLVLDVGSGSGCIAVTIACEVQNAEIFATDISFEALMVARANSERHKVAKRISLICGDLLSCFNEQAFDIIVSNPPYIAECDFYGLDSDIRDFEPRVSLVGGSQAFRLRPSTARSELVEDPWHTTGEEGLKCTRKIINYARRMLKSGGWCIIEVGENQSENVSEIFKAYGFREVATVKDLSGMERVVNGKWKR